MSANDLMKLTRQFYEAFNRKLPELAANLAAPDAVWEITPTGRIYRGPEGFTEFVNEMIRACPDFNVALTNQFASNEAVVCELRVTGTNTGPLMLPQGEHAPTGRKLDINVVDLWEVHNGRITRIRAYFDAAGMLQQLGIAA